MKKELKFWLTIIKMVVFCTFIYFMPTNVSFGYVMLCIILGLFAAFFLKLTSDITLDLFFLRRHKFENMFFLIGVSITATLLLNFTLILTLQSILTSSNIIYVNIVSILVTALCIVFGLLKGFKQSHKT